MNQLTNIIYILPELYKGENNAFKKIIDDNKDIHIFQETMDKIFTYEFEESNDSSMNTLHFFFAEHFFKSVVGLKVWKKEMTKKKLSSIMSVSDEALVYLIYENNRYVWMKQIETNNYKKCNVKPKYTAERGGNVLNNGWTREGLIRYNALVQMVKNERKLIARKEYEEKYLAYNKKTKVTKDTDVNKNKEALVTIVPYVDSSTDEESEDDGSDEDTNERSTGEERRQAESEINEDSNEDSESEDNLDDENNQGLLEESYREESEQENTSRKRPAPKRTSRNSGRNRGETNTSHNSDRQVSRRRKGRRT